MILDEEIDIDATTEDLKLFADFMQQIVRFDRFVKPYNLEINLEEAAVLLALTDKHDCGETRLAIRKRLVHLAKAEPWEVLYIACDWDDLWVGRRAIAQLSNRLIHTVPPQTSDANIWLRLGPLSHAWQVAFLRLYMPTTWQGLNPQSNIPTPTIGELNSSFTTWANNFDPKKI